MKTIYSCVLHSMYQSRIPLDCTVKMIGFRITVWVGYLGFLNKSLKWTWLGIKWKLSTITKMFLNIFLLFYTVLMQSGTLSIDMIKIN